MPIQTLLIQIRNDSRVREEELNSFLHYGGLLREEVRVLNVFDEPEFDASVLKGVNAVLIGGASEASVLEPERYPFLPSALELVRHCAEKKVPTFASCFGFQLAVVAFGGTIFRDERDFEMGTCPIQVTLDAKEDILFHDVPDGFEAVSVHRERATSLPPNCQLLAYTDRCCHAFKIEDAPFWATQFHPEVDKPTLVTRLGIYRDKYTDGDSHFDEVIASAKDTPHSNRLVRSFIERLVRNKD